MPQLYYGNGIARGISQAGGAIASGMQQRALLAWQAEQKRLAKETELEQYNRETGRQDRLLSEKNAREDRLLAEKKIGLTRGYELGRAMSRGGAAQTEEQWNKAAPTNPDEFEAYKNYPHNLPTEAERIERRVEEQERQLEGAQAWLIRNDADPDTPGIQLNPAKEQEFKAMFGNLPPGWKERALVAADKAQQTEMQTQAYIEATGALGAERQARRDKLLQPPPPKTIPIAKQVRTIEGRNYSYATLGDQINDWQDDAITIQKYIDEGWNTNNEKASKDDIRRMKAQVADNLSKVRRHQSAFDRWRDEVSENAGEHGETPTDEMDTQDWEREIINGKVYVQDPSTSQWYLEE